MFDKQTIRLMENLPIIEDFTGETVRSRLTQAYLDLIRIRVSGSEPERGLAQTVEQLRQMGNGLVVY